MNDLDIETQNPFKICITIMTLKVCKLISAQSPKNVSRVSLENVVANLIQKQSKFVPNLS